MEICFEQVFLVVDQACFNRLAFNREHFECFGIVVDHSFPITAIIEANNSIKHILLLISSFSIALNYSDLILSHYLVNLPDKAISTTKKFQYSTYQGGHFTQSAIFTKTEAIILSLLQGCLHIIFVDVVKAKHLVLQKQLDWISAFNVRIREFDQPYQLDKESINVECFIK